MNFTTASFKIGDKVVFGRTQGEKTQGEVVKVGPARLSVKQTESRGTMRSYPVGTIWKVPPSLCEKLGAAPAAAPAPAPARRRSEAEIMRDIQGCHAGLSPENLSCDGELSAAQCAKRAASIRARLRILIAELGRQPTEREIWGY